MRVFDEKTRMLSLLALILSVGFLTVILTGYFVSRSSLRQQIAEHVLPLTGDIIYSEIQKDLLRPVFISGQMAQNTFLRDWVLQGENDAQKMTHYLKEIKARYNTITAFFVSERTRTYYHAAGTLKQVAEDEPRDNWFFRVRGMANDYETNVDVDMANQDALTIFINYRVKDFNNNFIGVTGVGLTLDPVSRIIESYQTRYQRRIYFVDPKGLVLLAGFTQAKTSGSIYHTPGLGDIAESLLAFRNEPQNFRYENENGVVLVNSRFISQLGWFLVVEQDDAQDLVPLNQALKINLVIGGLVIVLVLLLAGLAIHRFQKRQESMAAMDPLTGLCNRQAFELLFDRALLDAGRSGHPVSAMLIDLDFFKRINDTQGHSVGDAVLQQVASCLRGRIRDSDLAARWGGETFVVLLRNCTLERARMVAESIRLGISREEFNLTNQCSVTASVGVAEYDWHDTPSSFFARVDVALGRAKTEGRDRVVVSERSLV